MRLCCNLFTPETDYIGQEVNRSLLLTQTCSSYG
nr:MAG TPA: hypothetical protein [Caudoviricetes sp.]